MFVFCYKYGILNRLGYFGQDRAREIITAKLKELPFFELQFIQKICIKCGIKGDARYIKAACHTYPESVHIKPLSAKHTGKEVKRHRGKIRKFPIITAEKIHPGCQTNHHSGRADHKYHPGKIQYKSVTRTAAFIFTLSISEWVTKEEDWGWYDCCNTHIKKAGKGCANKWTCCGQREENKKCNLGSNKRWDCCDGLWNAKGCQDVTKDKELWSCCKQSRTSKGCFKVYDCCNRSGEGCYPYYPCCDGDRYSEGCTLRCGNCREDWGTGQGCVPAM